MVTIEPTSVPSRQIRAVYDEETITVYQAYSSAIALAAVTEQRLSASPEFSGSRMTWIKPSWCWMMYRYGSPPLIGYYRNTMVLTLLKGRDTLSKTLGNRIFWR